MKLRSQFSALLFSIFSLVSVATATLVFSSSAFAGSDISCNSNLTLCETKDFVVEITPKRMVGLTIKAVPGATGDYRELSYAPHAVAQFAFGEEVYVNGDYKVEIGHTDGINLNISINGFAEQFFYETGTP